MNWGYQDNFKPVYFFLRKEFERTKTTKIQNKWFPPSHKFLCVQKLLPLLFFVRIFLFLLVNVCFWVFSYAQNLFVKKKVNRLEIVSIASIHYTTDVYPPQPAYWGLYLHAFIFICDHLWESLFFLKIFLNPFYLWELFWILFIFKNLFFLWKSFESFLSVRTASFLIRTSFIFFLSLYENKPTYEFHHLKQIFCHENMIKTFFKFHMSLFYVSYFEFFWLCVSLFFLLNKASLNSLNAVAIFTPFAILHSLQSIFFIENIFDFNLTKSATIFPSNSSFI